MSTALGVGGPVVQLCGCHDLLTANGDLCSKEQ